MATITKTPSNTWKAVVRKRGWPVTIKTFRTKRDAADWARSTEDEMVRGVYINRVGAERLLFDKALDRYLAEVSASKRPSTAYGESRKAKALKKKFDAYSLAAITPDLVAEYRDERLAAGKSADTVRLELALLSHLFTIAIKEWRLGLIYNPVSNIRKPAPGKGRDRRLGADVVPEPVPASPDAGKPEKAAPHTAQPGALPNTDRDPRTTTTNRPTDTNRGTDVARHRQALQFPEWVPHEIRTSAQHLVAELDQADAQLVIDEWAGALAAGVIQRSPLGYLKTLATRYRAGDMSVRYAIESLL